MINWLNRQEIEEFLAGRDYDIRKSHNARWIDQKCSADVVRAVAECIVAYSQHEPDVPFNAPDIWNSVATKMLIKAAFKKPGTDEPLARNEYDKFFGQPMEMLAYAGVLTKLKFGNSNYYEVAEPNLLDFIAMNERNSLLFLELYITKVLTDSGIYPLFEQFFSEQTADSYDLLKDGFAQFIISNTPINTVVECNRIFIKVLNPLAFVLDKRGTEQGRISNDVITQDKLVYNNRNFRDILSGKPKGITRQEHEANSSVDGADSNQLDSSRAKKTIRAHNNAFRQGKSEILDDGHANDLAVHAHHIFPESRFPQLAAYYENIIALTPTQHMSYAHPVGYTQKVDRDYQLRCILAKMATMKYAQEDTSVDNIYNFNNLLEVLAISLGDDSYLDVADGDYETLTLMLNDSYGV